MTISYFGDGMGSLRVTPSGDGWDIVCPACGAKDHLPYRVPGPNGEAVDVVAPGAVLTKWTCPNCAETLTNQPLRGNQ